MTKKQAAFQILLVTKRLRREYGGDEEADLSVALLEGIVYSLDQQVYSEYADYDVPAPSRKTKLRRLIDHPITPQPEREVALTVLARLTGEPGQ